jgi:hypothetical protein
MQTADQGPMQTAAADPANALAALKGIGVLEASM